MKRLSIIFILMTAVLLSVASCGSGDEPDGNWAPMKWTNVNNLMNFQGVYYFPEEAGSYIFLCRNYEQPWFNSIQEDGVMKAPDIENPRDFAGGWYTLKFEGNKLTITVESLPASVESRSFSVDVTAGDIFDHLYFCQQRNVY